MSDTKITQHTDAHGHEQTAVRTGGKFSTKSDREGAAAPLVTAEERDWGVAHTYDYPANWGEGPTAETLADGIAVLSASSHGGIKLSPERNAEIPAAYRNRNGWYEQDAEAAFVYTTFADDLYEGTEIDPDTARETADASIRETFPEKWEKANGRELQPGESKAKDLAEARAKLQGKFTNGASYPHPHDDNLRLVRSRVGEHARTFVVPKDAVKDKPFGTVELDPSELNEWSTPYTLRDLPSIDEGAEEQTPEHIAWKKSEEDYKRAERASKKLARESSKDLRGQMEARKAVKRAAEVRSEAFQEVLSASRRRTTEREERQKAFDPRDFADHIHYTNAALIHDYGWEPGTPLPATVPDDLRTHIDDLRDYGEKMHLFSDRPEEKSA